MQYNSYILVHNISASPKKTMESAIIIEYLSPIFFSRTPPKKANAYEPKIKQGVKK